MFSVFNTPRFDSGYMFGVSLRGLLEELHTWTLVFQRNAWFDSGFMLMRQTAEAGFAGGFAPRAVLSSLIGWLMMLGIMAGMVRMDSYALLWQWHVQGWYCSCHSCCHARCVQRQVPYGSECRQLRWSRSCSALTC